MKNSDKTAEDSKFYLTEPEQKTNELLEKKMENSLEAAENLTIPFSNGKQILELLNQIEEKSLYYIQNTHESEEELEKQKKTLKELREKHEAITKENNERLRILKNAKNVLFCNNFNEIANNFIKTCSKHKKNTTNSYRLRTWTQIKLKLVMDKTFTWTKSA